jgi:integrase
MSQLRTAADDYLALRRSLGYKLTHQGRLVADFVSYMDSIASSRVTVDAVLAWATRPEGAAPAWLHARLSAVRGFAVFLKNRDPATEVPEPGLLPDGKHRADPYIYTDDEIIRLLAAAGRLPSPLRAATYRTLFGLMAVTGLRIGEAVGIDRGDIDWTQELLSVMRTKYTGSRQLPLHHSTMEALGEYAQQRDALCLKEPTAVSFFVSMTGTRLIPTVATRVFASVCRDAGIGPRSATCRPRLHDLRHTYSVKSLIGWYRAGEDVARRLPELSTYLGHTSPASTYWYLSGTPELLGLAVDRLERADRARP